MNEMARFFEYAMAFEETLAKDDWTLIEPYFTEDVVYEIFGGPPFAGKHEGRSAVVGFLRASVNGFDRLFAERVVEMRGEPSLRDGAVYVPWRGIYRADGLPDLAMDGVELAWFEGDRIRRLEDHYTGEEIRKVTGHMERSEGRLKGAG
ncbi:MAG: nuclear transport factor 2 family protein [Myxococcales bacterium]|nr:MAG: nuclear transport factor 2 family protein [Myxococcales bacterium]